MTWLAELIGLTSLILGTATLLALCAWGVWRGGCALGALLTSLRAGRRSRVMAAETLDCDWECPGCGEEFTTLGHATGITRAMTHLDRCARFHAMQRR